MVRVLTLNIVYGFLLSRCFYTLDIHLLVVSITPNIYDYTLLLDKVEEISFLTSFMSNREFIRVCYFS